MITLLELNGNIPDTYVIAPTMLTLRAKLAARDRLELMDLLQENKINEYEPGAIKLHQSGDATVWVLID